MLSILEKIKNEFDPENRDNLTALVLFTLILPIPLLIWGFFISSETGMTAELASDFLNNYDPIALALLLIPYTTLFLAASAISQIMIIRNYAESKKNILARFFIYYGTSVSAFYSLVSSLILLALILEFLPRTLITDLVTLDLSFSSPLGFILSMVLILPIVFLVTAGVFILKKLLSKENSIILFQILIFAFLFVSIFKILSDFFQPKSHYSEFFNFIFNFAIGILIIPIAAFIASLGESMNLYKLEKPANKKMILLTLLALHLVTVSFALLIR